MMGLFSTLIIVGLSVVLMQSYIKHKENVFEPEQIVVLGKKVAASGASKLEDKLDQIIRTLEKLSRSHSSCFSTRVAFMKSGGWLGTTMFLHVSPTEFLKIYGTPITTQGHSGRHWANITDVVITGWISQWKEGQLRASEFGPGKEVNLNWGESAAVEWKAGTWVIEYGRGFTPLMLGYGLSDTIFSSQDFLTVLKAIKVYVKCMLGETIFMATDFISKLRKS